MIFLFIYFTVAFLVWYRSHEGSVVCKLDGEDTSLWWLFDLLAGLLWPLFVLALTTAVIRDWIKGR